MFIFDWLSEKTTVGVATVAPSTEDQTQVALDAVQTPEELKKTNDELQAKVKSLEEKVGETKNVFITPETLSFAGSTAVAGPLCGIIAVAVEIDSLRGRVILACIVGVVIGIFFYALSIATASPKAKRKPEFGLVSVGVAFANTVLLISAITGIAALFPQTNNEPQGNAPAVTTVVSSTQP